MGRGVFICPSLPGQQRPGNLHMEIMGKRIRDFLSMEIASGGDSRVKPVDQAAERLPLLFEVSGVFDLHCSEGLDFRGPGQPPRFQPKRQNEPDWGRRREHAPEIGRAHV